MVELTEDMCLKLKSIGIPTEWVPGFSEIGPSSCKVYLADSVLDNSDLSRVSLIHSRMEEADLRWSMMKRANLLGANLDGAIINKEMKDKIRWV